MKSFDHLSPDDHLIVPDHVRCRQFDDELVLVDLEAGDYYALNAVGVKIWLGLTRGATPGQIAAALEREYEESAEVLLRDCLDVVAELLERRLVQKVSSS
jgi:hypothetical protein